MLPKHKPYRRTTAITLTSTLNDIILSLMPVFTEPSGNIFQAFIRGWMLCPSRRTVTGIIPYADPLFERAHDAYHRFLRCSAWATELFWKLWAIQLISVFVKTAHVWLHTDDTVFKKTGRKIDGAKFCRDAVRSTKNKTIYVWGLQIVPLCLCVHAPWGGEPLSLPVNMRIYRKGGPSLLDLVEQMLHELAYWLPGKHFYLTGDGFYASLAGRNIPRVHIISRIRHDASLYELPRARKKHQKGRSRKRGKRLATPATMARQVRSWTLVATCERGQTRQRLVYCRQVLWYAVNKVKPVLLVISRDPDGKEHDDFFFTTDCSLAPARVVSAFADRWAIEDTFRNLKQYLGAEQPQCYKNHGPEKAAVFSCFLYGLTWLWFIQNGHSVYKAPKRPWYQHKQGFSFQDALATLRLDLWRHSFLQGSKTDSNIDKIYQPLLQAAAWAA